jgi:hypothetical protein
LEIAFLLVQTLSAKHIAASNPDDPSHFMDHLGYEVPGAGLSKEVFIEPATSGFLKPDYESGALAPPSGSDQAEPPRQKDPSRVYG